MRGSNLDEYLRRCAIGGLAIAGSAVVGVGTAHWTMAEASGFYTNPVDHGPPLYARSRPVAESFWDRQANVTPADAGYSAGAGSTATSVQPAYLSASGS